MASLLPGKAFSLHVPFNELLGIRVEHWEEGRSLVRVAKRAELTNSWEAMHGGVVMTLVDVACAVAAHSILDEAQSFITVNLSLTFLSAGSGGLVAEGRVLRSGKSLVFCEAEVRGEDGVVVAKGVGTFKVRRRKEAETAAG